MRIGVDLGGTKIEALAILESGEECFRQRVSTPQGDYQGTIQTLATLVLKIEEEAMATGVFQPKKGEKARVGIGIPGTISAATGLVKNANSVCLIGQPLDRDVSALLGRPVKLANDANCFALSEAVDGAGKGYQSVFGVILGTGVGGGLIYNQQVIHGRHGIAGEWGHNPLPWPRLDELDKTSCYCGKKGCIETWLSGTGWAKQYQHQTGTAMPTAKIYEAMLVGEAEARHSFADYLDRLARGLAHVINIYDPDVIVLGGGLSNMARLYEDVPQLLSQYVFSDVCDTPVLPAQHGDSGGVRGAAWLAA